MNRNSCGDRPEIYGKKTMSFDDQRLEAIQNYIRESGNTLLPSFVATFIITYIFRVSGLLTQQEVTLSQLGLVAVLFFVSTITVSSVMSFQREDSKYLFGMSLILGLVSLFQWTYSFQTLANEPWSMVAAQLPLIVTICAFTYLLKDWTGE